MTAMQLSNSSTLPRSKRAVFHLCIRSEERVILACLAMVFTVLGIGVVNPHSLRHFAYYLCLWHGFIFLFHREDIKDFSFAFLINSACIVVYYLVQTWVFPDSYGTTSPLGSWTDDSFFYALVADTIPADLLVRDNYDLYSHPFTNLIRCLTILSIDHPMDVIFFQSGIAATLATFSKRFMFQLSSDRRLSNTVYVFALVCPFLMMNGGVIFIRDTFSASLLIYSLCCINSRKFFLALGAVGLQIMIRPGTALMLFPLYAIIYYSDIKEVTRRYFAFVGVGVVLLLLCVGYIFQTVPELSELGAGTTEGGRVTLLGRELFTGLTSNSDGNVVLLSIQELPFFIKLFLNGAYIFLYPFLSLKAAFAGEYFDLRSIMMNLVTPIYAFWLNAWFIAGALSRVRVTKKQTSIIIAVIVTLLLIGTYSLQTRQKTTIYPLYYFIVAIGFNRAPLRARQTGYLCSFFLILLQVALNFR